jgi:hypothetical protein
MKLRKEIKRQIIAGIDKNELVCLKFSKSEIHTKLRWEHAKEFEFSGEMYDIVESATIGDSVKYWCWLDYKETLLNKELKILVAENFGKSPQNKERQNRIDTFSKSLCAFQLSAYKAMPQKGVRFNLFYFTGYSSIHITPPVPPPKMF